MMRKNARVWLWLAVWMATFVATAAAQPARPVPANIGVPLTPQAEQVAAAVPSERTPAPPRHYFRSNEWRQDLLVPHLEQRGGAYVGVGSDQNYTMAALARSEFLFLVDFDPRIPFVHQIYTALITPSETPEELIARFAPENVDASAALIERRWQGDPQLTAMVRHFRRLRHQWHPYLRRVSQLSADGRGVSWLADRGMYDHIRVLHRTGRVVARNGDVTGERTLRAIGDAAKRLSLTVRTVYFSNAEQFFYYTPSFVANMKNLPTDDRTIVVRTINHRDIQKAEGCDWHYMVQEFPDFIERLDSGVYRRSFALVGDLLAAGAPHLGQSGISVMTRQTPRRMLEEFRRRRQN